MSVSHQPLLGIDFIRASSTEESSCTPEFKAPKASSCGRSLAEFYRRIAYPLVSHLKLTSIGAAHCLPFEILAFFESKCSLTPSNRPMMFFFNSRLALPKLSAGKPAEPPSLWNVRLSEPLTEKRFSSS